MISVSYIITVYNKAPALPEVIKSLKEQEGDFDKEYIFVDDGSTDDSLKIIKTLFPSAIIISQANKGPSAAVNNGLKVATKQWIYLVDGDDFLYPDATQTLLTLAETHQANIACGKHSNIPLQELKYYSESIEIYDDPLKKALQFYTVGASTAIVDRELMNKVKGCDERIFVQDYSLALRLSKKANRFILINKLIAYNIDAGQQRLSKNKLQENHDTAAARYFFIKDNHDINHDLKLMTLQLFLRKAFKWYLRHNGLRALWSKHFWRYLVIKFTKEFDNAKLLKWMEDGLKVYKGNLRLPHNFD